MTLNPILANYYPIVALPLIMKFSYIHIYIYINIYMIYFLLYTYETFYMMYSDNTVIHAYTYICTVTNTLITLSLFLSLTRPSSDLKGMNANSPSMWVKISSTWVCAAIYLWTLVAPVLLADREFN